METDTQTELPGPWRPLSLLVSLFFCVASFALPDSVNDVVQWPLYALAATSFYVGFRRRPVLPYFLLKCGITVSGLDELVDEPRATFCEKFYPISEKCREVAPNLADRRPKATATVFAFICKLALLRFGYLKPATYFASPRTHY